MLKVLACSNHNIYVYINFINRKNVSGSVHIWNAPGNVMKYVIVNLVMSIAQ